jgi:tetratricopeptide (TPR) repeat protein
MSNWQGSFIGDPFLKTSLKLTLLVLLCLLAIPRPGFGQQAAVSNFASLVATAQQAQAAQDYAAAANAYKQALKLQPNMAELWANLGLMEQETGDISQAVFAFQHANRLNPSLYVPNLFLGIDYVRTGRVKEAIPLLSKAEKSNSSDPEPSLALGRAYTALSKYSLAAHAYRHAADLNPKQSSTLFALGIAYLDQVEADSRRMSSGDQNSPYVKALFAESLDKQSRYAEAVRIYKSIIDLKPQPPCLLSEMGWSLLMQQQTTEAASAFKADQEANPQCGLSFLGQARIALNNGNNDEALMLLQQLWGRDQGFFKMSIATFAESISNDRASSFRSLLTQHRETLPVELYEVLTATLSGSAREAVTGTVARDSKNSSAAGTAPAARGTAESYYRSGKFQHCSDLLQPGMATAQPDNLLLLATCSFFTGDYERSSEASAALAGVSSRSVAALYWSIKANERLAFQALARYEQLEPNSAKSHILLGDIFRQRVEYIEALAEYKKAQEIDPTDRAAMLGIASAYLGNNDIDKAIETARAALPQTPDDPQLNLIMAEALVAHHDYAQAEPYLDKSLKAKPQMLPHVHALLGKVYAEAGRTQDAIAQFKIGAESDDDGSIHYQLARLYRQIGDNKSASEALEQMKLIQKQEHEQAITKFEEGQSAPSDDGPQ